VLQTKKDKSPEQYRKAYEYREKEGEYCLFDIAASEEKRCSAFQLNRGVYSKEIIIRVEVTDDRGRKRIFQDKYVYFKLEGEESFPQHLTLQEQDVEQEATTNNAVFVVLKMLETRSPDLLTVELNHQRSMFDHVGSIPTKYRSNLSISYNPNTYSTVRKLLTPQLPAKLSKNAYQQCYFALVQFIQAQ
jgi:hypothetical protein